METKDNNENSFIGLPYKTVRLLLKESCIRIDAMSRTLLSFERHGRTLSPAYCIEYENLLLERLSICNKLYEYYADIWDNGGWFMRWLVRKRLVENGDLHKKTLSTLMLLRNYMKLHNYD